MRDLETIRRMEREDWDRNAAFYRGDAQSPLMLHLAARRDALYALQPGERVLDLGCGTGATIARLRAQGIMATGVDFSPEMIRIASEQHSLSEAAICADANDLPFDDHSFDVVIADGVLHHLAVQGKLIAALREVRRVLKPGGRLCVFDRNGSVTSALLLWGAIHAKALLGWVTRSGHYPSSATRNEIPFGGPRDQRLLKRYGFRSLRWRPVASAPFFISVVLLNAMQYFLSRRLRERLEVPVARIVSWIDDRCAWSELCVEQISVWESVAPCLPQRTLPSRAVRASRDITHPISQGVPEGRNACSPALSRRAGTEVASAIHTPSPGGTAEADSHHEDPLSPELATRHGGAT